LGARARDTRFVVAEGGSGCIPVTLQSSVNLADLALVLRVAPDRFTNFA
jgi:hypothetical protein